MFLTPKHAFIHMNKTGGTFLLDYAQKVFPDTYRVAKHMPLWAVTNELRYRKPVGMIRHPFDWYASWFHYAKVSAGKGLLPKPTIAQIAEKAFAWPHLAIVKGYRLSPSPWRVSPYLYRVLFFFCSAGKTFLTTKRDAKQVLASLDQLLGVSEWTHTETLIEDFCRITGASRVSEQGCNRNAHASRLTAEECMNYIPAWAREQDIAAANYLGYGIQ